MTGTGDAPKKGGIIDMSAAFLRNFFSPTSDMTVDGFGANPLGLQSWRVHHESGRDGVKEVSIESIFDGS